MGLKAGWIALFLFVWIIGIYMGSTFDFQSTPAASGQTYNTGTATFTNADDVVSSGGGAVWVVGMEDGNIQATADEIWSKIEHVGGGYLVNRTGVATGSPLTLAIGANAVTVTRLGVFRVVLPVGNTGTATSGVCTVVGSPVALVAGNNDITTTGVDGAIDVTTVGVNVIYLYTAYTGTGGAGLAYTMRPTPGWAGTGGGGYSEAPSTTLGTLLWAQNTIKNDPVWGTISVVTNGRFWTAVFMLITWQWSFCNPNYYPMFYWIFLFPFVAMGFLSILLLAYGMVTGNVS